MILDVDGTLIDSTYHHTVAWMRAFAEFGLHPPVWRIHRAIGMSGEPLVSHVTDEGVEDSHGDELRERWERECIGMVDDVRPCPRGAEFVHACAVRSVGVALASSGKEEFLDRALDLLGLTRDEFAVVVTSDDVSAGKPHPALLDVVLEQSGVPANAALMIGDTSWDGISAARAEVSFAGVRTGGFGDDRCAPKGQPWCATTSQRSPEPARSWPAGRPETPGVARRSRRSWSGGAAGIARRLPEGHTIDHAARAQRRLLEGRAVRASSPQGRFAAGARDIDGRRPRGIDAVGKHLLYDWGEGPWLHVHLGLLGRFRYHVAPFPRLATPRA